MKISSRTAILQVWMLLLPVLTGLLPTVNAQAASTIAYPPTIGRITAENRYVPRLVPVYTQDFEGDLTGVEFNGSSVFVSSAEVIAGQRSAKFETPPTLLRLLPQAVKLQPLKTYYIEFEYRVITPGLAVAPLAVTFSWAGVDPAERDVSGPVTGIFPSAGKYGRSFRIGNATDASVSFFNFDSEVVIDNIVIYRHDSLVTAASPQIFAAGFPRLLSYHLGSVGASALRSGLPIQEVTDTLGLFDVVTGVDIDHTTDATFSTRMLRERNPNLIILPYLEAFVLELKDDIPVGDSSNITALFNQGVEEAWYMRGPDGGKLEAPQYPNHFQMNHTRFAKQVDGVDFTAYIHHFVTRTVLPSGLWQGIHFDQTEWFPNPLLGDTNGFNNIGAELPPIDLDEDGSAETEAELVQAWDEAFANYFSALRREVGNNALLYGNAGEIPQRPSIYRHLNGMQRELTTPYRIDSNGDWVTAAMGGWFSLFERHRMADQYLVPPQIVGFQYTGHGLGTLREQEIIFGLPERENILETRDFQRMRLGLTSTLLHNTGFFGYNYVGAASAPIWFDEYAVNADGIAEKSLAAKGYLGQPLAEAEELAAGDLEIIFEMDFEGNGTPPPGLIMGPGLQVTSVAEQVLNGNQSAVFEYLLADPESAWIFRLDPQVLALHTGAVYQLSMQYRVLSQSDPEQYNALVTIGFSDGGAGLDVLQRNATLWDADTGQGGELRTGMLVERQDASASGLFLGPGKMVVDNLILMKGATAFRRDFENGIVLVNPSSLPIQLSQVQVAGPRRRTGIKRILGTQDPSWNDGTDVSNGITIPAADGIILLADRQSVGPLSLVDNVQAQISGDTVTLSWWAPSQGPVAGYVVRYGLQGGDLTQFALCGPEPSIDIRGLAAGSNYQFRIQAFDFLGHYGPASTPVTAQTPGQAAPSVSLSGITPLLGRTLTPGTLFRLEGANLSPGAASAEAPFPAELSQTQVFVNGVPARLNFVTPTEVIGFIPWNIVGDEIIVRVENQGVSSPAILAPFRTSAPDVQTWDGELAIALRADTQAPVLETDPARPGEDIVLVVTGLGTIEPLLDNGQRPSIGNNPLLAPVVEINGQAASGVTATIFDAGYGVYSAIRFRVPDGIQPGLAELIVESDTERSPVVKLWVGE